MRLVDSLVQRSITATDAAVAEPLIGAPGYFLPVSDPASGLFCELVSSRSCMRLGFYLHAWILLDILGLLLCS